MSDDAAGTPDPAAEPAPPTLTQQLLAEGLGTFIVVVLGCGALSISVVAALQRYSGDDYAPQARDIVTGNGFIGGVTFGLALVGVGLAFRRLSGTHFNPATSLGAALAGRLSWAQAGLYALAQVVGAVVAGATLLLVLQGFKVFDAFSVPIAANGYGDKFSDAALWSVLVAEAVGTFLLVIVHLAAFDARNPTRLMAPLTVGLVFGMLYVGLGYLDNGGINPARSLGVALFSGSDALKQVWVFLVAPLVGGAVAGVVHPLLFGRDAEPVPGSGLALGAGRAAAPPAGYGGWGQQYPEGQQYPGAAQYPETGQGYPAPAGQAAPAPQQPQQEQPIIENGWQWDPQSQQWIPAPQPPDDGSTAIRP